MPTLDSLNRFMSATAGCRTCGRTRARTSTTTTTRAPLPHRVRLRHALQLRRGPLRGAMAPSPASPTTCKKHRHRTMRGYAHSSKPSSTARTTPRCRRPARSTGNSTRAGRRCSGRSTTTMATRPAATSVPRKANTPVHALYALDNGTVTLDNLTGGTSQSGLSVEAKVYNLAGTVTDDRTASNITLASQQVETMPSSTPVVPGRHRSPTTPTSCSSSSCCSSAERHPDRPQRLLAVDAIRRDQLGTVDRQPAGSAHVRSTRTCRPCTRCAPATITATATTTHQAGPDGADLATTVTLTNTSPSDGRVPPPRRRRRGTASGPELSATTASARS